MRTVSRSCVSCTGELPEGALFCPRCGTRTSESLDPAPGAPPRRQSPEAFEAAHRAELQRALGDAWELRHLVGRGGFAEVYAAWDVRLKREVAIKTIRPDIVASATVRARFQREAEAVATLRHPHIVPIYWVGEEEGHAFFVMPLIEGESLAAVLERRERVEVDEACRILRETAEALAAAHARGIVHRDVKPENIMLEGEERRVVVMDFGIAKRADLAEHGLTASGMVIGSPHYISPEQATGGPVDHRADQYALGVAGYHLLTGQLPFEGKSIRDILVAHATVAPAPVRQLRAEVPPRVAAVIERALAKDPDDRWPSMSQFAAELAAAVTGPAATVPGRRASAGPERRAATARSQLARWRRGAIAAIVAGIALMLATLPWSIPEPALDAGAAREPAHAAAAALLSSYGAPADVPRRTTLVGQDSVFRFLQLALGDGRALAAAAEAGVWRWEMREYDPARDEAWSASVAADGRVLAWSRLVADSAAGARLDTAEARRLAASELRARGWDPAALRPAGVDSRQRASRTDHTFRWVRPGAIAWGADSAVRALEVTVTGERVTGYAQRLHLPASFLAPAGGAAARNAATVVGWLLVGLAVVLAVVLATRRGRTDALQWRMALRLALVPAIVLTVMSVESVYADATSLAVPGGEGIGSSLIGFAFIVPLMFAVPLYVNVAGESLAHEHRPAMTAGLLDVARGRLLVPELAPRALVGYAVGLALVGMQGAAAAAGHVLLGAPRGAAVEAALGWQHPALGAVAWLAAAIAVAMFLMHALALALHYRGGREVALALPAIGYALLAYGMADRPQWMEIAGGAAVVLAVSATVWHAGALAAIVALFVAFATPDVVALLRTGAAEPVAAGAVGVAALAVPAVLAVAAARRMAQPRGIEPGS